MCKVRARLGSLWGLTQNTSLAFASFRRLPPFHGLWPLPCLQGSGVFNVLSRSLPRYVLLLSPPLLLICCLPPTQTAWLGRATGSSSSHPYILDSITSTKPLLPPEVPNSQVPRTQRWISRGPLLYLPPSPFPLLRAPPPPALGP